MSAIRQVRIVDCQSVVIADDNEERAKEICHDLLGQLRRSVQLKCKHLEKRITSTSESGSNTCFAGYYCPTCSLSWTDELLPAHYLRLLEDDYTETEQKAS